MMQRRIRKTIILMFVLSSLSSILFVGFSSKVIVKLKPAEIKSVCTNMHTMSGMVLPKLRLSSQLEHKTQSKKYDLLINSYMNGGSTFTGKLFGFRTDAFYIYEPLWNYSVWGYFHADNLVCSSKQGSGNCRIGNVNKIGTPVDRFNNLRRVVKLKGCNRKTSEFLGFFASVQVSSGFYRNINNIKPWTRSRPAKTQTRYWLLQGNIRNVSIVEMMIDVLDDIYKCDFSRLENVFDPDMQVQLGGPDWKKYRSCMKSNRMFCLKAEEKRCKKAEHRVTKVLRLTTGSYDQLLERRKHLKFLQLFRNPFAIINSRTETKTYPVKDYNLNAAALCTKMVLDYEGCVRLAEKYPGRVKMAFYEDIKSNVIEKVNKLYEYIGMEPDNQYVMQMNKVKIKLNKWKNNTSSISMARVVDNAHWWRNQMSFLQYQGIREKCRQLIPIFNLTNYKYEQDLKNSTLPDMNLPSAFLV